MEEKDKCIQNDSMQDPERFNTNLEQQTTDPIIKNENEIDTSDPIKVSDTVYHTNGEADFISIASIETQPALYYNQTAPLYSTYDYSYDPDKVSNYPNTFYGYENYGIDYNHVKNNIANDTIHNQEENKYNTTNDVGAPHTLAQHAQAQAQETALGTQQQQQPGNKVVAVNPVILVDKVERSLIVQWYENNIRREQRISYKKYGNAKAQQRAESLINKLLAGSTFDQLYPEKGPPILTIFENVGEYMVSLTRDRIQREWRVDWVNANGVKMRARWSCKKVGNEEARKRADTFANSLIQGVFNPRLLHKATGTRLSRNDMKYNAVVNTTDYGNFTTKKTVSMGDDGIVDVAPKRSTSLRRTKSEVGSTRRRRSSSNTYGSITSHTQGAMDYGMYKGTMYQNPYYVYPHVPMVGDDVNMQKIKGCCSQVPSPLPDGASISSASHSTMQQQQQNWSRWHLGPGMPEWDYQYYGMPSAASSSSHTEQVHQMPWLPHYMPSMDMVSIDEQSTDSARLGYYHPYGYSEAQKVDGARLVMQHDPLGYFDVVNKTHASQNCFPSLWQDFEKSCNTVTPTTRSNELEGGDSTLLQHSQQAQKSCNNWPSLKETEDEATQADALLAATTTATLGVGASAPQEEDVYQQMVQQQQQQQQQQQMGYLYGEGATSSNMEPCSYYNTSMPYPFIN